MLVEIDEKEEKNFFIAKSGKEITVPSVFYPDTSPTGVEFPRKVVVSVDGRRSNAYPFRQSPNPVISSIVPEVIAPGDKITLTGNFVVLEGENKKKGVEVRVDKKPVAFLVTKPGKEIVIPRLPEPKESTGYKWEVVVLVNDHESNRYTIPQQQLPEPVIFSITPKKISQGDKITIKGNFLAIKKGSRNSSVKIKIDGKPVDFDTKKPGEEIEVVVGDKPAVIPSDEDTGEFQRFVTVEVDGQQSDSYVITQLTWKNFWRGHVLIPLGILLIVVLGVKWFRRGNPLKSKTGQLSLSKIQMALWTLVFGFAYTALSAIWWDFLDITEGMFVLMGISSVTAVGAKAIVIKNVKIPVAAQILSHDVWSRGQEVDQFQGTKASAEQIDFVKKIIPAGKEFHTLYPDPPTDVATKDLEDFLTKTHTLMSKNSRKKLWNWFML